MCCAAAPPRRQVKGVLVSIEPYITTGVPGLPCGTTTQSTRMRSASDEYMTAGGIQAKSMTPMAHTARVKAWGRSRTPVEAPTMALRAMMMSLSDSTSLKRSLLLSVSPTTTPLAVELVSVPYAEEGGCP